eukprot:6213594-Pleurochrysis_carterae.AAC.3
MRTCEGSAHSCESAYSALTCSADKLTLAHTQPHSFAAMQPSSHAATRARPRTHARTHARTHERTHARALDVNAQIPYTDALSARARTHGRTSSARTHWL